MWVRRLSIFFGKPGSFSRFDYLIWLRSFCNLRCRCLKSWSDGAGKSRPNDIPRTVTSLFKIDHIFKQTTIETRISSASQEDAVEFDVKDWFSRNGQIVSFPTVFLFIWFRHRIVARVFAVFHRNPSCMLFISHVTINISVHVSAIYGDYLTGNCRRSHVTPFIQVSQFVVLIQIYL
jgi:hypothetical protein